MVNERRVTADIKLYSDQINKIRESMGLSTKAAKRRKRTAPSRPG